MVRLIVLASHQCGLVRILDQAYKRVKFFCGAFSRLRVARIARSSGRNCVGLY